MKGFRPLTGIVIFNYYSERIEKALAAGDVSVPLWGL